MKVYSFWGEASVLRIFSIFWL